MPTHDTTEHVYRDCLIALEQAVIQFAEGASPDVQEVARCLLRAVNTGATIRAINGGNVEWQQLAANRKHLHGVFGAPGDWGYETKLGEALRCIYAIPIASKS